LKNNRDVTKNIVANAEEIVVSATHDYSFVLDMADISIEEWYYRQHELEWPAERREL
jgi:hypothetical protein